MKYVFFGVSGFISVFITGIVHAGDCTVWNDALQKRAALFIGDISITTGDVFDPQLASESTGLHRLANKLHIKTRPSVIRSQLLFASGDAFDLQKLKESQRLIQANRYIKEATIEPVSLCGKRVNIRVSTKDMWTLTPGVSFGRSGGKNRSGVEIQEHNLFGLGKSLVVSYKQGSLRDSTLFAYSDPQLWGSRKQFQAKFEDNSDGKGYLLDLQLPFFALDSRHAWGIKTSSLEQDVSLYQRGDIVTTFPEKKQDHSVFYGWSKGLQGDHTARFKVGWQLSQNDYHLENASRSLPQTGLQTGSRPTKSLTESYPWFEFAYLQDNYVQRVNFKTMDLRENVSLGLNASAKIGLLARSFGSDDNQLRFSTRLSRGYELGAKNLGFIKFDTDSYLGSGIHQGSSLSLQADWYAFNQKGNNYYLSGRFKQQTNLLPDEQVLLGGASGLRGYPEGFQAGDKSLLFTAEKRYHFNWYPLHLAKFGAVAFADVGTAWGAGSASKTLADVGLGLRIIPTRSSSAKSIHIDLALPINQRDKAGDYQFLVETRASF